MKKIAKTNELMWLLGTIFLSLGVCLCKKADLGVSMIAAPTFIVNEAISDSFDFLSVGMMEYIYQGIVLIILCLAIQKFNYKFLFAFLSAVIYGFLLDFWLLILKEDPIDNVILRWVIFLLGDVFAGLGIACFFRTFLPLQVHELFVSEFSKRYNLNISAFKWIYDITCLIISIILVFSLFHDASSFNWSNIYKSCFHNVGLGTIVTTIINAPIIAVLGKGLDKLFDYSAMFPSLETYFKN